MIMSMLMIMVLSRLQMKPISLKRKNSKTLNWINNNNNSNNSNNIEYNFYTLDYMVDNNETNKSSRFGGGGNAR